MYKYKIFEAFDNEIENIWKELEINNDNIFYTFDWHKAWNNNIGKFNSKILIILIEKFNNDGKTIIIFPLIIKKYFFCSVLEWSGYPFSDLNSPITNKNIDSEDIEYFITILEEIRNNIQINIFIAINQLNLDFIKILNQKKKSKIFDSSINYFYNFNSEDFNRRKSGELKYVIKDIERQKRRIRRKITFINNPLDINMRKKIFHKLIKFIYEQYERNNSWNFLKKKNYVEFLNSQVQSQNVHISCLSLDHEVIAAHMGYLYKDNFFYILPAYDYRYKNFSVGNILLLELFQDLKKNCNKFDFTIGGESYKSKWTNNKSETSNLIFYLDVKGYIFYLYILLKKKIKKTNLISLYLKSIYHLFKK